MRRPRAFDEEVGAPLPTKEPPLLVEVGSFGEYDEGEGAIVMIEQGNVLFLSTIGGAEMVVGVSIETMLDSIAEYNRKTGS